MAGVYEQLGQNFNDIVRSKNFEVAPRLPSGKPGKNVKSMREYRLQLINKTKDTSSELIKYLGGQLLASKTATQVKFNPVSPNSSKFPSYSFYISDIYIDLIIAKGANKGENFETNTVTNLDKYFKTRSDADFGKLIEQMNAENVNFAQAEIKSVAQRKGSTKKENVAIEKLGEVIGDIVLVDINNNNWYISLKDINGNTFSSYSGAASLFNANGDLQPNSEGATFLRAFGVDLNKVQEGFDTRRRINTVRDKIPVVRADTLKMKKIFERAWGMNYFYVRKQVGGWKVFWLDRAKLDKLTTGIRVTDIRYPTVNSKQITIFCEAGQQKYLIEIRNSKAGEYPNDTKFKVKP